MFSVYMCLPVWREWKLKDLNISAPAVNEGLHVPSRLEGMETVVPMIFA